MNIYICLNYDRKTINFIYFIQLLLNIRGMLEIFFKSNLFPIFLYTLSFSHRTHCVCNAKMLLQIKNFTVNKWGLLHVQVNFKNSIK